MGHQVHETSYRTADGEELHKETFGRRIEHEVGDVIEKKQVRRMGRWADIRFRITGPAETRECGWKTLHTYEVEMLEAEDEPVRSSKDLSDGTTIHREADGSAWREY